MYLSVNKWLVFILFLGFIYIFVFSFNNLSFPIKSGCKIIPCASSGLQRSMGEMLRGNYDNSYILNSQGPIITMFFVLQFVFRIMFSFIFIKYCKFRQSIIAVDAIGSTLLFIFTFEKFIFLLF